MTTPETLFITAAEEDEGHRLDQFLTAHYPDYSRSWFQKCIRDRQVLVNGLPEKSSYRLAGGDRVLITIPQAPETHLEAEDLPLDIRFEDADLLVINKAAGMVVHPGAGNHSGTLVNALMHHCTDLSGTGGKLRPGIVHRLDKNTSGLMVVARNDRTHVALQKQFSDKSAWREYFALVWHQPAPASGLLETYIERSKSDRKRFSVSNRGKIAITGYQLEESFDFLSLMRVKLQTGRTHQIRVHFKHLGHPVFGDGEYGGRDQQINRLSILAQRNFAIYLLKQQKHQALHAFRLGFRHPSSGQQMEFSAELPQTFRNLIEHIKRQEGHYEQ